MTFPDVFIEQDNPKKMYELAGLNSSQISKKILDNFAYYWEFCKSNLAVNYILFLSQ